MRLKILKKLRTASLNSKFTGSYKKVYKIEVTTKDHFREEKFRIWSNK